MNKTFQRTLHGSTAFDVRPNLRELSSEANELWERTGSNPLESDECYLANFVARLERTEIRGLVDLVAADNVLELIVRWPTPVSPGL